MHRAHTTAAAALLCAALCSSRAMAQTPSSAPQTAAAIAPAPSPPAAPADVDTIEHIVAALYDTISGPAGQKRNWDRLRSLFAPDARMIPTFARRPPGIAPDAPLTGQEEYASRALSVEDYIARAAPRMAAEGFYERETARRAEQFGHIAHVFSTYESRHKADDAKPFQRGINSIQLMNDGHRWWVVTIFWEGETQRTPLPKKYLRSTRQ